MCAYLNIQDIMDKLYYLRNLKNNEITKLENLCEKWNAISFEDVPEEESGEILAVIGQAKLLIKEKIAQFAGLLDKYENNAEQRITIEDLEGFWDLVNIQIDDIIKKFNTLDKLQSNSWMPIEEKIDSRKNAIKRDPKKLVVNKGREEARRRLAEAKAQIRSNAKNTLETFFI